jgi:hypothetical protein
MQVFPLPISTTLDGFAQKVTVAQKQGILHKKSEVFMIG